MPIPEDKIHKLLGVKRDTYMEFVQFKIQLNLTSDEAVKFLIRMTGLNTQSDMTKDSRVREVLRLMKMESQ